MDFVKHVATHAKKRGFLQNAVRLKDGQPRIVGKTPWDEYRGDLDYRIGFPDHEGLQEWIAREGLELEPGMFLGPLTLHRVFCEIARVYGATS